jgi:spore maturation protein CgeB
MRIIYLSPNMAHYTAAYYQNDIMEELRKQQDVFFYGPGFPEYNEKDDIHAVFSKAHFDSPDLVCVGHAWLEDTPKTNVIKFPAIKLSKLNIPKVMILNKEYTNLDAKLNYIKNENFQLVFTHHHEIEKYKKITGVEFIYWPFAVNHNRFKDYKLPKEYDLTFTGLLRNPTFPHTQSDVRVKVQRKIFYTLGEFRVTKRKKYKKYNVFWQARPTNNLLAKCSRVIHREYYLSIDDYSKHLNKSKICLNALSPVSLISPRYFEAMASKCLAFCQESILYKGLFEEGKHYISFKENASDFDEKLFYYLEHESEMENIVNSAYHHVRKFHTWEKRIDNMLNKIGQL